MSLDIAPMSELDAVNSILAAIGDSPVNSLEDSELANSSLARQELHNMSRQVQSQGWQFNYEKKVLISKDTDGNIQLGANCLRVKPAYRDAYRDVAQRGSRLYDKENRTFVFTDDIYVDRVLFLEWDDLPSAARDYIAIAAARKYQKGYIGSKELAQITEEDEMKALVALKDAEGDTLSADFLSAVYPFSMLKSRRVL